MLDASLRFVLSAELLGEYRAVLLRPRIAARHGLSEAQIDTVLQRIALNAEVREPDHQSSRSPDLGGAHLWALLATVPSSVLVTRDRRLVRSPPEGRSVVTPSTALGLL